MKRKIIAIKGKIGSGKSVVGRYLSQKGFTVVDCDVLARKVADMPEIIAKVQSLLGEKSVKNGQIDRAYVRETIFADDVLLRKYNAIFNDKIKQMLDEIRQKNDVVFAEVAPVKDFEYKFDTVIFVATPREKALARASSRDGVTLQNVTSVWENQDEVTDADFVLVNVGSLDELYEMVDNVLSNLDILL